MTQVPDLLQAAITAGVSDIHLLAGSDPRWRVSGELVFAPHPIVSTADLLAFHRDLRPNHEFNGDDFAFDLCGHSWRANGALTETGPKLTLRLIPATLPNIFELGLPQQYIKQLDRLNGLHLVTGPTGSGKTTTLAAIIRHLARLPITIITLEDPIEQKHPTNLPGLIYQRELGRHFTRFGDEVMRGTLRQDPDVILFGELRDRESVRAALTAAETGHMVFATLHNETTRDAVSRLLDACSDDGQSEHAAQVAKQLNTVLAQRLVRTRDNRRTLALEYLAMTNPCRKHVRDRSYERLPDEIERGSMLGMISLTRALVNLVRAKKVTREVAIRSAPDPTFFESLLPE